MRSIIGSIYKLCQDAGTRFNAVYLRNKFVNGEPKARWYHYPRPTR